MALDLPAHSLVAVNTATSSENKIHDDDVAASLGFGGGLVPGVEVYAYLCQPVVAHWGIDFLTRGRATTRFGTPTYDGERIEVLASIDDDDVLRAGVHPAPMRTPAPARAGVPPNATPDPAAPPAPAAILEATVADEPPEPPDIARGRRPERADRPPASPESLAAGTVLGSFPYSSTTEDQARYLADISDEASPVVELGVLHPGTVLRLANDVLSETVLLGPWIHVGSTVHNHAPIAVGEEVEVRGIVTDNTERKGHRFVDLDVVVLGRDGSPRTWVEHTAIYQPRQLRTDC